MDCVKKGLHRGLAEAPATLMWSTIIVFNQPGIEIGLQLVDRVIDLLAECDPVKLIQHSAMKALAQRCGQAADRRWAASPSSLHGRPLRLARMRCERGSVGVVLPASSRSTIENGGYGHADHWTRYSPRLCRGGGVERRQAQPVGSCHYASRATGGICQAIVQQRHCRH